jgi:hypothetical protein
MIYLLRDCYRDGDSYYSILKIGYSKKKFSESRKSEYDTHNYGYEFLGERDGSPKLELFLHRRFKEYNLKGEWFRYSDDIVKAFWEIKEDDIYDFTSQDDINLFIRGYIPKNLSYIVVPKLLYRYIPKILENVKEVSLSQKELESICESEARKVFEKAQKSEISHFGNLDFTNFRIIENLKRCGLVFSDTTRTLDSEIINKINCFYKLERCSVEFPESLPESQSSSLVELVRKEAWNAVLDDYRGHLGTISGSMSERKSMINDPESERKDAILEKFNYEFSKSKNFQKRLRLYCEFMDTYRDDAYLVSSLILDDPKFETYYNFFGTEGCRAVSYREFLLKDRIDDFMKTDKMRDAIYETFRIGQKYSSKYIKEKLKEFHREFGISATPKATDLENYYELKPIQIFTNGKRDRGFLILGEK